ncbi:ATP-grasp domain-containing protein [Candidatus Uabimicrobium sp. HlEnr_7]|uniref:ATP-grasp domain-containing protein n=1 Tax=Candidatus Uabimicrobium helgolandensis TaxID=3095367 RepID=UPI0035585BB3
MVVTWIFDFDYDFTAPKSVSAFVDKYVVLPADSIVGSWPDICYPCVAYGTMRKLMGMIRQPKICEAVFDDYSTLRCSYYYRYIYEFLGRAVFIVPFAALGCLRWDEILGERVFIRPDSNCKPFEAEVVAVDSLDDFIERNGYRQQHELVVVSEVVDLGEEYRCFCRDGRVFCHSSYPLPPYTSAPPHVIAFAEKVACLLVQCGFSSMLTIDIACGDRLRVVEIGGVNSWGIYGGCVHSFIKSMEEEAIFRQNDIMS